MNIQRDQPTHEIADVECITIDKRSEKSRKLTMRFVAPEQFAGVGIQSRGAICLGSIDDTVCQGNLQKLTQRRIYRDMPELAPVTGAVRGQTVIGVCIRTPLGDEQIAVCSIWT